jgi:hypothetical protein
MFQWAQTHGPRAIFPLCQNSCHLYGVSRGSP